MVFKGRRLMSLVLLVLSVVGGLIGGAISYWLFITHKDFSWFLKYMGLWTSFGLIYGIFLMMISHVHDIVLTSDELQGPEHYSGGWRKVSVPLASVDLSKSKKRGSFWRSGFIATSDGHKISLDSSYLGRKQVDKIFKELEQRLASKSS